MVGIVVQHAVSQDTSTWMNPSVFALQPQIVETPSVITP